MPLKINIVTIFVDKKVEKIREIIKNNEDFCKVLISFVVVIKKVICYEQTTF